MTDSSSLGALGNALGTVVAHEAQREVVDALREGRERFAMGCEDLRVAGITGRMACNSNMYLPNGNIHFTWDGVYTHWFDRATLGIPRR